MAMRRRTEYLPDNPKEGMTAGEILKALGASEVAGSRDFAADARRVRVTASIGGKITKMWIVEEDQ